jgi:hypothetical protein
LHFPPAFVPENQLASFPSFIASSFISSQSLPSPGNEALVIIWIQWPDSACFQEFFLPEVL